MNDDTSVDIAVGHSNGKVILRWREPTTSILFDPQNAFGIAEAMARAAHEARFGAKAPSDRSYLQQQVKARLTADLRDRLVGRVSIMLHNFRERNVSHGTAAMQIVDTIFSAVGD